MSLKFGLSPNLNKLSPESLFKILECQAPMMLPTGHEALYSCVLLHVIHSQSALTLLKSMSSAARSVLSHQPGANEKCCQQKKKKQADTTFLDVMLQHQYYLTGRPRVQHGIAGCRCYRMDRKLIRIPGK